MSNPVEDDVSAKLTEHHERLTKLENLLGCGDDDDDHHGGGWGPHPGWGPRPWGPPAPYPYYPPPPQPPWWYWLAH